MELISKDSIFDEAFKIISTNKLKANSLRQSLLQNNNPNDELNLKTIQFLGEIEYDLKSLYDILRDLKISYKDIPNNLIHSSFRNNRVKEENEKNDFDKIKNKLKEPSKTYYVTSNKFENNSENNNNDNKDLYINSCPRPDKFRNISFNSYEGNCNLNLSPLSHKLNSINTKQDKEYGNYINDKYPSDIQQNDNYKERNITNIDLPFKKKIKLNFDYDNYLTDYSLNKTNRNEPNSNNERNSNYNDRGQNLNLSDLKNENNFDNKNNNYDTSKFADNKNSSIKNKLDNENLFTFGAPKNNQNLNNNYVLSFDPNNNNNNNNNNLYDNQDYNDNMNNHKIKYSYNDFINKKYNNNSINSYRNSNKIEEEDDGNNIEGEKKEILNKIIPDVFQNKKKLYLLKSKLGDDIEEKLLNGNINEEDLFKVVQILKNNQDLMNNKGKKLFKTKKYNQPNDKILLKETIKDKRYSYREFPRGWTSTKDYFVNNGTTSIKNRKGKKY